MIISIGKNSLVKVITVFENDKHLDGAKELYSFVKEKELFEAKNGETYCDVSYNSQNIILLGLGDENKITLDSLRKSFFNLGKKLAKLKIKSADIKIPVIKNIDYKQMIQAIAEGLLQSEYAFEKYLSKKKNTFKVENIYLDIAGDKKEECQKVIDETMLIIDGIFLARDLTNEPAMKITPKALSEIAKDTLEPLGVKVDIFGRDKITKLGMEAFLAVSRGSAKEPQFIIMSWNGNKNSDEKIALVGKGLTYDSGGYSLKPTDGMVEMKSDMAGSAAVIGTMKAIAGSEAKQNVVAIVAACENMISGDAYKPGDIIGSMSGKTIEILNTDAEGRVTLADALWYAATVEKASKIIDIATLTGACVVALGDVHTGAITNNDDLMKDVMKASEISGEPIWQLPSHDGYREIIKGTFGDLKNTGGRDGGAITAGLFLEEFVNNTPWVHLDIAGTSFITKEKGYLPKGATGVMVKTLYNLVSN